LFTVFLVLFLVTLLIGVLFVGSFRNKP
jgi:hypothetical protein